MRAGGMNGRREGTTEKKQRMGQKVGGQEESIDVAQINEGLVGLQ